MAAVGNFCAQKCAMQELFCHLDSEPNYHVRILACTTFLIRESNQDGRRPCVYEFIATGAVRGCSGHTAVCKKCCNRQFLRSQVRQQTNIHARFVRSVHNTLHLHTWCACSTVYIYYTLSVHSLRHGALTVYNASALAEARGTCGVQCNFTHLWTVHLQITLYMNSAVNSPCAVYTLTALTLRNALCTCIARCKCTFQSIVNGSCKTVNAIHNVTAINGAPGAQYELHMHRALHYISTQCCIL